MHTARAALTKLEGLFPGKLISKGGSVQWPPRLPDLTIPDFFLWRYLKSQVYSTPIRSLQQLKRRVRAAVRAVPEHMVQEALAALPVRLRKCSRLKGGHMILTKSDLLPYVPFNAEACFANARRINPAIEGITLSATSGEGMDSWFAWIERHRAGHGG